MATPTIVWEAHEGLSIRDVPHKWHARVQRYMLEHYFRPHRLFAVIDVQTEPGVEEQYLRYLAHILEGECCLLVLDEAADEIRGVALLMWMTRAWRSWTQLQLVVDSPAFGEFLSLRRTLFLNFQAEHPEHAFDSLHLFEFHLGDELQADAVFMAKFFGVVAEVARHMRMPRVTFLALSGREQAQVEAAGYSELVNVIYSLYLRKGRRPFDQMRNFGEMTTRLYELEVPPLLPYYEMGRKPEVAVVEEPKEAVEAPPPPPPPEPEPEGDDE